jgi:peroxiredoxin
MKKTGIVLLLFALFFGCASTGQSPSVGKIAPDFSITDVSGDEVRLSDFKGKKNVVLVFYADSGWSLSSRRLGELQEKISEIENLDGEVVAFATAGTQDDVEISKSFHEITFTLIPTPNRSVSKQFGVRTYATIIIDKDGIIRFKEIDDITSASYIVEELQAI